MDQIRYNNVPQGQIGSNAHFQVKLKEPNEALTSYIHAPHLAAYTIYKTMHHIVSL